MCTQEVSPHAEAADASAPTLEPAKPDSACLLACCSGAATLCRLSQTLIYINLSRGKPAQACSLLCLELGLVSLTVHIGTQTHIRGWTHMLRTVSWRNRRGWARGLPGWAAAEGWGPNGEPHSGHCCAFCPSLLHRLDHSTLLFGKTYSHCQTFKPDPSVLSVCHTSAAQPPRLQLQPAL